MTHPCPLPRYGSRVMLRRLEMADLEAFQQYRHDEAVGRYQGWSPWSDAEALAFLDTMSRAPLLQTGQWFQVGIAEKDKPRLIGDIGVCVDANAKAKEKEQEAEIGFTLAAASQGRGLGSEAVALAVDFLFENTEIDRVVAITDTRNLAAIGLLRRLGMQQVRTEDAVFRGEPCQEHVFSLGRPA